MTKSNKGKTLAQMEEDADAFARNYLMPEEEFEFRLWYYSQEKNCIRKLSEKFGCPISQVIKRMEDIVPKFKNR